MKRSALAALLVLAAASPALAYEEDTHYYLCYVAARLAGLPDRDAHIVASAAQGIDEAPATTPLRWSNLGTDVTEVARLNRVLPKWHAMSANGNEADVQKRRGELREEAFRNKGDLIGLGRYAHFTQDWYSHQPENGRHYQAPHGHLLDFHFPDFLATDRAKAQEMARAWMKDVAAFVDRTGRTPDGPKGADAEKVLLLTLDKLVLAHQNGLSHADVERELNETFRNLGLELVVPAYDRRIVYAFDEDGTPHAVVPGIDLPPLLFPFDSLTRRLVDRAVDQAADSAVQLRDMTQVALRAARRFEAARLDEISLVLRERRLSLMRREILDLRSELDALEKEIRSLEAEIEKLTNVNKGPCVCGAATHAQCKKGKECQDIERAMGERLIDQVRPKKARRKEILEQLDLLPRAIDAEAAALDALRKRVFVEPPTDLRKVLAPDAVLTPRLREVLPKLLPYLPPGAVITSGYRSPERQLEILRQLARENDVPWDDAAAVDRPDRWLEAWRSLLQKGVVVNPPVDAKLADGTLVHATPHAKGNSFDVSGAPLDQIVAAMRKARDEKAAILPQIKPEPRNGRHGCVHVQVGE